jgi:hypothetical protein
MSYELSCIFVHETDKACLIIDPASEENIWIPLDQVEERHGRKNAYGKFEGEGTIIMSDWIAKRKGLL